MMENAIWILFLNHCKVWLKKKRKLIGLSPTFPLLVEISYLWNLPSLKLVCCRHVEEVLLEVNDEELFRNSSYLHSIHNQLIWVRTSWVDWDPDLPFHSCLTRAKSLRDHTTLQIIFSLTTQIVLTSYLLNLRQFFFSK